MDKTNPSRARRGLLKTIGLGAASAVAGAPAAAAAPAVRAKAGVDPVVAQEFWTTRDGVKLWVYRKHTGPAGAKKPLLFLVHGSSYSGKTMFDLHVPGRQDYSMMDHFARLGYDVWTMDHEGYGHSDRTKGYSDIATGVEDLAAAMAVVTRETGQTQAAFFGQSSGALRAARFANVHPQHVSKLMLDAVVWTGKGSPTLAKRKLMLPQLEASNVRKVDHAFYASVFTRDEPGAAEPMIGNVVADEELRYGDTVPNGTYRDMVANLPVCDPDKILCPVLVIRAEHDGIATDEDVMGFFGRLPNADKQMTKIGGLAHTALLGINRHRFYHTVNGFLSMPERIALGARPAGAAAHG
jgi:pimeloyl-ACP methyl ester carboxylesterase